MSRSRIWWYSGNFHRVGPTAPARAIQIVAKAVRPTIRHMSESSKPSICFKSSVTPGCPLASIGAFLPDREYCSCIKTASSAARPTPTSPIRSLTARLHAGCGGEVFRTARFPRCQREKTRTITSRYMPITCIWKTAALIENRLSLALRAYPCSYKRVESLNQSLLITTTRAGTGRSGPHIQLPASWFTRTGLSLPTVRRRHLADFLRVVARPKFSIAPGC
jgi:hypothetical protein